MKITFFFLTLISLSSQQQVSGGFALGANTSSDGYPTMVRQSGLNLIPTTLLEKELIKRGGINLSRSGSVGYPEGGNNLAVGRQFAMNRQGSSFIIPNRVELGGRVDLNEGFNADGNVRINTPDRDELFDEIRNNVVDGFNNAVATGSSFPDYAQRYMSNKEDLAGTFVNETRNNINAEINTIRNNSFVDRDLRDALENRMVDRSGGSYVPGNISGTYNNYSQNAVNKVKVYNADIKQNVQETFGRNFNQDLGRFDENLPKRIELKKELERMRQQGYQQDRYEGVIRERLGLRDDNYATGLRPPSTNGSMNPNVEQVNLNVNTRPRREGLLGRFSDRRNNINSNVNSFVDNATNQYVDLSNRTANLTDRAVDYVVPANVQANVRQGAQDFSRALNQPFSRIRNRIATRRITN